MFCGCGSDGVRRSHWVSDLDVAACKCGTSFTTFTRRHHCRRCGDIFCNACSGERARVLRCDIYRESRVCQKCVSLAHLENQVDEHYAPFLRDGGFLQKQGVLRMRRVFAYLSPDNRYLCYRSADKPEDTVSIKRISLSGVRHVHATSARSFKLSSEKDFVFEADTRNSCKQWTDALSAVVKVLRIPEPWNQRNRYESTSLGSNSTSSLNSLNSFSSLSDHSRQMNDDNRLEQKVASRLSLTDMDLNQQAIEKKDRERHERRERLRQKYALPAASRTRKQRKSVI